MRNGLLSSIVAILLLGPGWAAALQTGDVAPDFTLRDIHDVEHSLSDYRGKVVVLALVGYSCPPCRVSLPAVEQVWQDYSDRGVQVLTVDLWDGPLISVLAMVEDTGATHPVLRDGGALRLLYDMPVDNFAVIDPDGMVRYLSSTEAFGGYNDASVRATIEDWLPTTAVEPSTWSVVKSLFGTAR